MSKKYKRAILIGRYEPLHNGHRANAVQAFDIAEKVLFLVGSANQPRTPKNPFTFTERKNVITDTLTEFDGRFSVYPLKDFKYSNNKWISEVQRIVREDSPLIPDEEIAIIGYDKDDSSWYNHAFPEWDFVSLEGYVEYGHRPIDATKVRELVFEGNMDFIKSVVPSATFNFINGWVKTEHYTNMVEEYLFYKDYHKKWESAPFVPIFQTTDAVVVQGGHVLLIQRGHAPGKGLWALPGGFLNPRESIRDCVIRELVEETKIKVPEIVLRKSITYHKVFDHPDRDLRGRTITQAYLIELTGGDGKLPKVKGSDDAKKAKWFKLSKLDEMEDQIYADHRHIIETLISRSRE